MEESGAEMRRDRVWEGETGNWLGRFDSMWCGVCGGCVWCAAANLAAERRKTQSRPQSPSAKDRWNGEPGHKCQIDRNCRRPTHNVPGLLLPCRCLGVCDLPIEASWNNL